MQVLEYTEKLNNKFKSRIATEHSYRSDLLGLIESLVPGITITNEPKRVACGAPDYILTKRNIPVGYIEAKDIGADLNSKTYKEQFDRYRQSLDNLIITDYLTFHFFVNGSHTTTVTIGEITGNKIHPITDNFERFIDLIKNFCDFTGQTIKSAQKLSKMMAAKAKLLANVIELALDPENETEGVNELQNINLLSQYESFRQVLIHDITPKAFADIYAQTIAYGMFAARLNDPSLENFTRQEAAELIPKSNPFLRKLFQYIAGYDLDDRIVWIVDALADIFRATNVDEMLRDFGKATHQTDPFIHFYETFLAEYDPKLRKSRGVWYTPEPVVNFLVRAVDDILKTEFGLSQGLADTSKIKIKVPGQEKKLMEKDVHRVQILDPAAGTGTFLAEVIKQIHKKFEGQQGIWSQYVDDHLIPRLHGFEILMASYAMAHLKLDLLLKETGYFQTKVQRLKVYLTNSLEEYHPDTGTLFANWLSSEANEANHVKRDTPVMVILGNPPYSISSSNNGEWIQNLLSDYKKDLNERNIQPLSDDYIKFIRFGQYYIEKNGSGVLAYISNNSYADGIIHRQMRKDLLECFDRVYILNLHGNSKRKERSPDGSPDQNVFDIMQGVSINILIKKSNNRKNLIPNISHYDLFGTRQSKYDFLNANMLQIIPWTKVKPVEPYLFFVPKDFEGVGQYENGFRISSVFEKNSVGIVTSNDGTLISLSNETLKKQVTSFYDDIKFEESKVKLISYRAFDDRYLYYDTNLIDRARDRLMRHLFSNNLALVTPKQAVKGFHHVFISKLICDKNLIDSAGQYGAGNVFPLYLYPENTDMRSIILDPPRTHNFNIKIINIIEEKLGLKFVAEKEESRKTFSPIDILDFIYAVLHSPKYREKFQEFLKVDFPRIPYPKDQNIFWQLVTIGSEIRKIHLLESPVVEKFNTIYPVMGSNEVDKVRFEMGKVWINAEQYFDGVLKVAWEFYIGGYQPAQKWLKDRKGKVLSYDEIMHYQKIIVALTETDRIMKEIDKIDFLS
jgi:type I restriction-modification system DNA methylase subunit